MLLLKGTDRIHVYNPFRKLLSWGRWGQSNVNLTQLECLKVLFRRYGPYLNAVTKRTHGNIVYSLWANRRGQEAIKHVWWRNVLQIWIVNLAFDPMLNFSVVKNNSRQSCNVLWPLCSLSVGTGILQQSLKPRRCEAWQVGMGDERVHSMCGFTILEFKLKGFVVGWRGAESVKSESTTACNAKCIHANKSERERERKRWLSVLV